MKHNTGGTYLFYFLAYHNSAQFFLKQNPIKFLSLFLLGVNRGSGSDSRIPGTGSEPFGSVLVPGVHIGISTYLWTGLRQNLLFKQSQGRVSSGCNRSTVKSWPSHAFLQKKTSSQRM
jgi:hypothetical protein